MSLDDTLQRKKHTFLNNEKIEILKNMINGGSSVFDMSIALAISLASVKRHKKRYEETGQIILLKAKRTVNTQLSNTVVELVQSNNATNLEGIKRSLEESGIHTSKPTICRILKGRKISRKRLQKIPAERNSPSTLGKRTTYCRMLAELDDSRLIFVDETGVNLHTNENYGYAPEGMPAVTVQPANKGENISCLVAINRHGIMCYQLFDGAVNAERFRSFLHDQLHPQLRGNSIVIMDNARIHHSILFKQYADENSIRVEYLPPYSPQLNPIEEYFSKLKYTIRYTPDKPVNRTEMKLLVSNILIQHQNFSMLGYFRHMRIFVEKGYRSEIF